MNSLISKSAIIRNNINLISRIGLRAMSGGEAGSGAGKGGGSGGSIRDAGGAFGKMEVAQEEQYIRKLQQEQLKTLKKGLEKEVDFHKKQIDAHKKALDRHKDRIEDLDKTPKK